MGQEVDRKSTGRGHVLIRNWTGIGQELDRKRTGKATGIEQEVDRKWTGNGQEMDRKWTGSGQEVGHKVEHLPKCHKIAYNFRNKIHRFIEFGKRIMTGTPEVSATGTGPEVDTKWTGNGKE